MAALGYDRSTTAAMVILGAMIGVIGATVNPFSIGVAAGEAGVSLGDGSLLRILLWIALTAVAVGWVLRYAAKRRRDPASSLAGWDDPADDEAIAIDHMAEDLEQEPAGASEPLTSTQKWVLVITVVAFGWMIFSVIPWSSIFGDTAGPAEYYATHETAAEPSWFELNWWFPQLAMPLLSPLADLAGASRSTTITAWIRGHGLTLLWSPTSVVVVGGRAIAKVGYDKYLRFVWPLILALFVVSASVMAVAATRQ